MAMYVFIFVLILLIISTIKYVLSKIKLIKTKNALNEKQSGMKTEILSIIKATFELFLISLPLIALFAIPLIIKFIIRYINTK